jgi:hypothetical protein
MYDVGNQAETHDKIEVEFKTDGTCSTGISRLPKHVWIPVTFDIEGKKIKLQHQI